MITLKDIARATGVSCGTVSSVLNGKSKKAHIGDKTTALILKKARQMGYKCDDMARAIRTGTSRVIGFLGLDCSREYVAASLVGCMQKAAAAGYVINQVPMENYSRPEDVALLCMKQRFAGVVCHILKKDFLSRLNGILAERKIKVATISNTYTPEGAIHVGTDDEESCMKAVDYLHGLQHRRIAVVNIVYQPDAIFNTVRTKGFLKGIKRRGLKPGADCVISIEPRKPFSAVKNRLLGRNPPTAICCVSDYVALGVLETALEAGLKVPQDFSIFGYGNVCFSPCTKPALSTVREKHFDVGARAIELILSGATNVSELIRNELVIRDSTAKAPD